MVVVCFSLRIQAAGIAAPSVAYTSHSNRLCPIFKALNWIIDFQLVPAFDFLYFCSYVHLYIPYISLLLYVGLSHIFLFFFFCWLPLPPRIYSFIISAQFVYREILIDTKFGMQLTVIFATIEICGWHTINIHICMYVCVCVWKNARVTNFNLISSTWNSNVVSTARLWWSEIRKKGDIRRYDRYQIYTIPYRAN